MLTMTADEIRTRAGTVAAAIATRGEWRATLIPGVSAVGGGSAPGVELPTWLVAVAKDGVTPDALAALLRGLTPPVIARIEHDTLVLDLRTVAQDDDARLIELLRSL